MDQRSRNISMKASHTAPAKAGAAKKDVKGKKNEEKETTYENNNSVAQMLAVKIIM